MIGNLLSKDKVKIMAIAGATALLDQHGTEKDALERSLRRAVKIRLGPVERSHEDVFVYDEEILVSTWSVHLFPGRRLYT